MGMKTHRKHIIMTARNPCGLGESNQEAGYGKIEETRKSKSERKRKLKARGSMQNASGTSVYQRKSTRRHLVSTLYLNAKK